MKLKLANQKSEITLPPQFSEEVRPDIIKRAVISLRSGRRQPYGTNPRAGLRHSVRISKRRRDYRGSYGMGISRVPRKVMIRRGSRFIWTGAEIPSTVGGRKAHPPKSERKWKEKINKKERLKSIRSAMAASVIPEYVGRNHRLPENFPFLLPGKVEDMKKSKDVRDYLQKLGLSEELERTKKKKIRPGKGRRRGRKYQRKKGPLIVVSDDCPLLKAARNIPGIDVVNVRHLNTEMLAPDAKPARLTLWTEKAIKVVRKDELFTC